MQFSRMISAIDAHACGEPGRVIIGGVPDVPGKTMFEKKVYFETHADSLRKLMLREPRGYPASNCNLILPPTHPDADAGFIIMEQVEYPPMSGTNTICVVTVLLETGIVPVTGRTMHLKLDTPAGLIEVEAEIENSKVTRVTFQNVPAFAVHLDASIEVQGLGTVKVDVAYGGMFYVIADAEPLGIQLIPEEARDIVRVGEMIKAAAQEQLPVTHPENPAIAGITIAQLSAPSSTPEVHRKNAVIVSTGKLDWNRPSSWTGALDRSPCAPALAQKWPHCTQKAHCRSIRTSFTREFWAPRSQAASSANRASAIIQPWFPPSADALGSPVSLNTFLKAMILSPKVSP